MCLPYERCRPPELVMVWAVVTYAVVHRQKREKKVGSKIYLEDVLQSADPQEQYDLQGQAVHLPAGLGTCSKLEIVQQWCRDKLPKFVSPEEWPPCTPYGLLYLVYL